MSDRTAGTARSYFPPAIGPSGPSADPRVTAKNIHADTAIPHGCPCKVDRNTGSGMMYNVLGVIPPDADCETVGIWHNAGPELKVDPPEEDPPADPPLPPAAFGFVVSTDRGPFRARIDRLTVDDPSPHNVMVNDPVGVRNGVAEWAVGSLGWRICELFGEDAAGHYWALIQPGECAAKTVADPADNQVVIQAIDEDGSPYGVNLTVNVLGS